MNLQGLPETGDGLLVFLLVQTVESASIATAEVSIALVLLIGAALLLEMSGRCRRPEERRADLSQLALAGPAPLNSRQSRITLPASPDLIASNPSS